MKKVLLYLAIGVMLILLTWLVVSDVWADNIITYGKSTWEDVDDRIIFGSYGDEYSISEFDGLGGNDFAHESHFKNVLVYEGYTEAYDYNPSYDGYYDSFYKQPLPTGKDLTKISIRGLGANPREVQDVYVLTSEYNKYSAQSQDTKINNNTSGISNNSTRIDNNVKRLDNHEGRIGDLEDTSYCVRGELQFVRKENLTVGIYGKTDLRHSNINREVGINIIIGLGKSASQKKREVLEKRIEKLEKKLGYIGVEPIVTRNEEGYIVSISEQDKLKVLKRF